MSSPSVAWTLPIAIAPTGTPADFLDPAMKHIVAVLDVPHFRFDADTWRDAVGAFFQISPERIVIERVAPSRVRSPSAAANLVYGTRVEFHLDLPTATADVKLATSTLEKQIMTFTDSCKVPIETHIVAVYDGDRRAYPADASGRLLLERQRRAAAATDLSTDKALYTRQERCDRQYLQDRVEAARHCEAFSTATTTSGAISIDARNNRAASPSAGSSGYSYSGSRCACFEPIFSEGLAATCASEEYLIPVCDYLRGCTTSQYRNIVDQCSTILPNRPARVAIVFFSTVAVIGLVALYEKYKSKSLRDFKKVKVSRNIVGVEDAEDYGQIEASLL